MLPVASTVVLIVWEVVVLLRNKEKVKKSRVSIKAGRGGQLQSLWERVCLILSERRKDIFFYNLRDPYYVCGLFDVIVMGVKYGL